MGQVPSINRINTLLKKRLGNSSRGRFRAKGDVICKWMNGHRRGERMQEVTSVITIRNNVTLKTHP